MTLNELNQAYYFHDSILNRIEYDQKELKIYCSFCDFMQKDYDESKYANSDIIVVFHNASYEMINSTDSFHLEESSFLDQKLQDHTLSFFMEKSSNEFGLIKIEAESVDVIKLRSYNL